MQSKVSLWSFCFATLDECPCSCFDLCESSWFQWWTLVLHIPEFRKCWRSCVSCESFLQHTQFLFCPWSSITWNNRLNKQADLSHSFSCIMATKIILILCSSASTLYRIYVNCGLVSILYSVLAVRLSASWPKQCHFVALQSLTFACR